MKHVLVTNGRNWLHNVYTIEKGQEWLKKHPDRKDTYIYADHQWFYRSDTDRYSDILNHEQGDLVAAIKANVPRLLKKAGFHGHIQISSMQLDPGERQFIMYRAVLTITACPLVTHIMRIGQRTFVQDLVDVRRKETHTITFSNVELGEYDREPVRIHGISKFKIE